MKATDLWNFRIEYINDCDQVAIAVESGGQNNIEDVYFDSKEMAVKALKECPCYLLNVKVDGGAVHMKYKKASCSYNDKFGLYEISCANGAFALLNLDRCHVLARE